MDMLYTYRSFATSFEVLGALIQRFVLPFLLLAAVTLPPTPHAPLSASLLTVLLLLLSGYHYLRIPSLAIALQIRNGASE